MVQKIHSWALGCNLGATIKLRVLMRVTNQKIGFLGLLIYELWFKTRCRSIVFFGISHIKLKVFSEKKVNKLGYMYDSILIHHVFFFLQVQWHESDPTFITFFGNMNFYFYFYFSAFMHALICVAYNHDKHLFIKLSFWVWL